MKVYGGEVVVSGVSRTPWSPDRCDVWDLELEGSCRCLIGRFVDVHYNAG